MSKRKPRHRVLSWSSRALLTLPAERSDGKQLVVLVDAELLSVTALETEAVRGSPAEQLESAFDSHAHKLLGVAETMPAAIAMAEDYAKSWLLLTASSARCECSEIPPTRAAS